VLKERRCDATFAYQQIVGDVYREVLDYTSRCVTQHSFVVVQLGFLFWSLSFGFISHVIHCCCLLFCSKVLRRIQGVSGVFGMVAPCDKTCLLHPVVGTFHSGDTVRIVLPAEVIGKAPWTLEDNKSCGLKMTCDLPRGKSLGTLTVRVCWCTTIFRDERAYIKTHFKY
jgi:hypothetical protein